MYEYSIRLEFEKEGSFKPKHNDCRFKKDFYIYITKEELCSIEKIKEEATSLFSPRFGKINFISIDVNKINDKNGLIEGEVLTESSSFEIEHIDSTIIQATLTRNGKFVLDDSKQKRFDHVSLDQIEKVIQYNITNENYKEYSSLTFQWLTAPRAIINDNAYSSYCLIKLKTGSYGLCKAYEKDLFDNKIKTNYVQFFKDRGLYEIQSFEDYKKLVKQLERQ